MKKHISLLLCFAMLGSLLCSTVLGADAATNNTVLFQLGNQSAYINGIEKQLPEAPQLINDRTMVPFRVLAESIGCSVESVSYTHLDVYKRQI